MATTSRQRGCGARVSKVVGGTRHGDECGWHQKNEGGKGHLVRTVLTMGLDGVVGGESMSGDEMRVKATLRLLWVFSDMEVSTR